jgi:hypothetical protein
MAESVYLQGSYTRARKSKPETGAERLLNGKLQKIAIARYLGFG